MPSPEQTTPRPPINVTAVIIDWHDGDTARCTIGRWPLLFRVMDIRVRNIDCPEILDPDPVVRDWAQRARDQASTLAPVGARIKLNDCKLDKYARIDAVVITAAGANVAAEQLRAGFAKPYFGGTKQPWTPADCHPPQS